MRFAVALVSGLAAAVSAQSTTASADPAIASVTACLDRCPAGDVNCQSHCITVPSPNEQQVNDTTKCAAACPQGNGSPEQTQKFADCVQNCISKHYYVPSAGTPQPTGGSGGSGSSSSGNSGNGGSNTASASGSGAPPAATGTGAAPSSSAGSGSGSDSGSSSSSGNKPSTTDSGSQGSGSKTSSGAAATSTNAAPGVTFGAAGALVGAFAAVLAL